MLAAMDHRRERFAWINNAPDAMVGGGPAHG
jgi:hypothetical protein